MHLDLFLASHCSYKPTHNSRSVGDIPPADIGLNQRLHHFKMASSTSGIGSTEITTLAGPMLLGSFFAWGLFGVLSTQIYMYFQSFPRDPTPMKALVLFVYVVLLSQIVMLTSNGFNAFARGFGDFNTIDNIQTWWFAICICEGLVACAVQSFYAWRIYVISQKKLPTALILVMSLISFVAAICVGASCEQQGRFSTLFTVPILVKVGLWESTAAVCDILIAGCMTYYLKRRVQEAGQFQTTGTIVNRIIRMTIETGSLTAGVAITTMAVTYIHSHPYYFMCPLTTFPGVYATTLMVVLNSRIKYSTKSHLSTFKDCQNTELKFRPQLPRRDTASVDTNCHAVKITVTQVAESARDNDFNDKAHDEV